MKKLALLTLAISVLALVYACTDAGDPDPARPGRRTADVTIPVADTRGDRGRAFTSTVPPAARWWLASADGNVWSATVADLAPGLLRLRRSAA
ncbi:MAG: hypothetical protein R3D98_03575 [Candidatus Krumholzibacteriia bacterium]